MKDSSATSHLFITLAVGCLFALLLILLHANGPRWSGNGLAMLELAKSIASTTGITLDVSRCQYFTRSVPLLICQFDQTIDRQQMATKLEAAGWRRRGTASEDKQSVDFFVNGSHTLRVTWRSGQDLAVRLTIYEVRSQD